MWLRLRGRSCCEKAVPMKCYNSTERDTVGICSGCGKVSCSDCRQDVGGTLYCTACGHTLLGEYQERKSVARAAAQKNTSHSGLFVAI